MPSITLRAVASLPLPVWLAIAASRVDDLTRCDYFDSASARQQHFVVNPPSLRNSQMAGSITSVSINGEYVRRPVVRIG